MDYLTENKKVCCKCNSQKFISEFTRLSASKSRMDICKTCVGLWEHEHNVGYSQEALKVAAFMKIPASEIYNYPDLIDIQILKTKITQHEKFSRLKSRT